MNEQRPIIGKWIEDKAWGRTRCLYVARTHATFELEVKAGTYCSWHYHRHRSNEFVTLSAKVDVVSLLGPEPVTWRLNPGSLGNFTEVSPLIVHQFRVIESGTLLERYWLRGRGEIDLGDISRLTQGGELREGETWDDVTRDLFLKSLSKGSKP